MKSWNFPLRRRLPDHPYPRHRRVGLLVVVLTRVALLLGSTWFVSSLGKPSAIASTGELSGASFDH